jgi:hypothetical protein
MNDIDQIFNECLDAILSGQKTVADCLDLYPKHAAELEGLLLTSLQISKAAAIAPPPGARMRIRYALGERAAELARRGSRPAPFWRSGWANAVATFVLGLSLAGGGVAYAASGSMPDEALYPLKLDMEQVLVGITFSTDAKIELYAALNDRRVGEIVYLAGKGDSLGIAEVTGRLESNFAAAAILKGISANEFATAFNAPTSDAAKGPDRTITATGTVPPDQTPTIPTTNQPPMFSSADLVLTENDSALDQALREYQAGQLDVLSNAPAGASPAVQEALERAMAAVKNGYDVLLS